MAEEKKKPGRPKKIDYPSLPFAKTKKAEKPKIEVTNETVASLASPITNKFPPPPGKSNHFIYYWNILVPEVADRPNFKPGYLLQLAVLCDLYVQKDNLDHIIEEQGYSYISEGTHGASVERIRPEVTLRSSVIDDIKDYTKILGLILYKDTKTKAVEGEAEWE